MVEGGGGRRVGAGSDCVTIVPPSTRSRDPIKGWFASSGIGEFGDGGMEVDADAAALGVSNHTEFLVSFRFCFSSVLEKRDDRCC